MGAAKWIAGFIGWAAFGPIGGLVGYFLGKVVDEYIDASHQLPGGDSTSSRGGAQQSTQRTSRTRYTQEEQRNSFYISLLVLSSAVIKADGKTVPAEVNYVRNFFQSNFGEQAAKEAMEILTRLDKEQVNVYSVGDQIASNMNYSQRLQLLQYLVQIAMADGEFAKSEKGVIEVIGSVIKLADSDVSSIIAMYYKEELSAYTILEISPSATDDEVRAAYRRMAMKYHPDRVSTLGPEVQKSAAERFQQVHDAYEAIKKQRGMK